MVDQTQPYMILFFSSRFADYELVASLTNHIVEGLGYKLYACSVHDKYALTSWMQMHDEIDVSLVADPGLSVCVGLLC